MIETIAHAVVEISRFVLIAYATKQGRDVLIHWLDTSRKPTAQSILDDARIADVDLAQLAQNEPR